MTFRVNAKAADKKLSELNDLKDEVMPRAYTFFKSITPKRSGNARRKTRLDTSKTIQANYAYAEALDSGASKQAPKGMVKPTEKEIDKLIKKYLKSIGA
jgi:ethanolamine ammonia-lyase small subunit